MSNVTTALDAVAPYKFIPVRSIISSSQVRTDLRHKRRAFRSLIEHPTLTNIIRYEKSAAIAKRTIQVDLRLRESKILTNKEPKSFWSYVNRRLSQNYDIKSIHLSGNLVEDQEDIANAFNHYFTSVFSPKSQAKLSDHLNSPGIPYLDAVTVSSDDVVEMLKAITPKTSNDGDGLSYKVLKEGGIYLATHLSDLFCLSLSLGQVRQDGK